MREKQPNLVTMTFWDKINDGIIDYCERNDVAREIMLDKMGIMDIIIGYYQARGLVWPKDSFDALGWMHAPGITDHQH